MLALFTGHCHNNSAIIIFSKGQKLFIIKIEFLAKIISDIYKMV